MLKAINQGRHGSYLKIADIGRDELTNDLGVISKRVPDWLVSNEILQECDLPPERPHIQRPDILLVEVTHAEQTIYATQGTHELLPDTISDSTVQAARVDHSGQAQIHSQSRQRKVWLLEGGYTPDTRHQEKIEEKRQQHKTLLNALEIQGYRTQLLILTFGVGGTIYKRTQDYLEDTGVGPVEMKKLLKDIHLQSVEYLHNIVVQRRQLDSEALRHQTHRSP